MIFGFDPGAGGGPGDGVGDGGGGGDGVPRVPHVAPLLCVGPSVAEVLGQFFFFACHVHCTHCGSAEHLAQQSLALASTDVLYTLLWEQAE